MQQIYSGGSRAITADGAWRNARWTYSKRALGEGERRRESSELRRRDGLAITANDGLYVLDLTRRRGRRAGRKSTRFVHSRDGLSSTCTYLYCGR